MKEYDMTEYANLYHKMQETWEELLVASHSLVITGHPHPAYVKFAEAELKARQYYIDWKLSGTMINKPHHSPQITYP